MTREGSITFIFIMVTILSFTILGVVFQKLSQTEAKVLSGEYQLACKVTTDGYTIIDKDKIVERVYNVWVFTNGYSKTCTVLK